MYEQRIRRKKKTIHKKARLNSTDIVDPPAAAAYPELEASVIVVGA